MPKLHKLHELLAVDGNLKAQADKTRTELMGTFEKKTHLFSEKTVSYKPYEENSQTTVESQLDIQTTVPKELKWLSEFIVKSLDVSYQVAEANTIARADVVLENGTVLLSQLPATSLLELEKRAKEMHDFVASIPTLDPAKGFRLDPDKGSDGIFKAREDRKTRTKKMNKVLTLAPPTDKHPAQVQVVVEDVPVGDILTLEWSGLITTAAKGDMLSRVEDFARAVKKARARANEAEIAKNDTRIGAVIVGYVFGL
jgi:Asp-tRNA(Asn)/Glu-tRNA(Gln) amidotransferase C subunit